MKRILPIASLALILSTGAIAQEGSMSTPAYIADLQGQIGFVQGQITSLFDAMPEDKFTWRPMDGVRSVGEVYRHITFSNYILLQMAGYPAPASANFVPDLKKFDTMVTEKAKIGAELKASFDHVKAVSGKLTEADLAKMMDLFGTKMTVRSATMTLLNHMHEHLGQSIAYARMNKVVPPWTAAEGMPAGDSKEGK